MRNTKVWLLPALAGSLLLAGAAGAQLPGGVLGRGTDLTRDARGNLKLTIRRSTISGVVKSVDAEKKQMIVETKNRKAPEVPVDVGPCIIKAGKGSAKLADIQPGDKVRVYGEVTVQGGLRAMEISLPSSRMTIPPPSKADRKAAEKKAAEERKAAADAKGEEKKPEEEGKR
jgi:hypothetical protein